MNETDEKVNICREDFYTMLQQALIEAGGGRSIEQYKRMELSDVVNELAQNGLRMTFMPEKHMASLKLTYTWEVPKPIRSPRPSGRRLLYGNQRDSDVVNDR